MATYKVLQDIEAEDKLIGPLTLKQFIFAIITMVLIFVAVMLGRINLFLSVPWLVPIFFFGFMASPIGRDQPNDVWLAARIRFIIKPRKRHWDQSGMQELVTITAPKKVEIQRTNNLSQHEVKSRLTALSNTLDSRGWAVKNVSVNLYAEPDYFNDQTTSDRLIDISNIPQEVPAVDVQASDDIMDPMNNMVAQRFDTAIKQRQQDKLSNLKNAVQAGDLPKQQTAPVDYSFLDQPVAADPGYATFSAQVIAPEAHQANDDGFLSAKAATSDDEEAFLEKRHKEVEQKRHQVYEGHEHVVVPISEQRRREAERRAEAQKAEPKPALNTAPDGILKELGQSGDDISVAAIASIAKHAEREATLHDNDIVSLH